MRSRDLAAMVVAVALGAAGCARSAGPPPIVSGTPCAACGMDIADLRFACEGRTHAGWRAYDSIECLIRDSGAQAMEAVYLADYDRQSLHVADSLWVVHGEFASPMGGGLAAFLDLAAADSIAAATRGRVDRFRAFMATGAGATR